MYAACTSRANASCGADTHVHMTAGASGTLDMSHYSELYLQHSLLQGSQDNVVAGSPTIPLFFGHLHYFRTNHVTYIVTEGRFATCNRDAQPCCKLADPKGGGRGCFGVG